MKCKLCGHKNRPLTHFCVECGSPLKSPIYLKIWLWAFILIAASVNNALFLVFLSLIGLGFSIYWRTKHTKVLKLRQAAIEQSKQRANISFTPTSVSSTPQIQKSRQSTTYFDVHEFESIPSHKIEEKPLTGAEIEDFEKVHYTNVTVRTNYDKLGSFVAIDTETTGLRGSRDEIVEIAAVKFENWKPVEKFETLINPQVSIPKEASRVNHIYDDMVKDAPLVENVIMDFSEFVKGYNIVGQNLNFDLEFLHYAGATYQSKIKYYDTIDLAKKVLTTPRSTVWDSELGYTVPVYEYDVENYKLSTLADYYGIGDDSRAHRATYDAYITGLVFQSVVKDKLEKAQNYV